MDNKKFILLNGMKVPVAKVKHWRKAPQNIIPMRSEAEMLRWTAFERIRRGWNLLDANLILESLHERFTYGSYWVRAEDLDLEGYRDYLPKKFNTMRTSKRGPEVGIAVLYESLSPEEFPYALRLVQGDTTTLLTMQFTGSQVSSLYMTDPDGYTYEPTFAKGVILDADTGEPRVFQHECNRVEQGRPMTEQELQQFGVQCIAQLYREAGAEIEGVYTNTCKEYPNVITRCGCDLYYHRVDLSERTGADELPNDGRREFVAIAKKNGAWPMALPVSLWCADTNGSVAVCGGSFFLKVREAEIVE